MERNKTSSVKNESQFCWASPPYHIYIGWLAMLKLHYGGCGSPFTEHCHTHSDALMLAINLESLTKKLLRQYQRGCLPWIAWEWNGNKRRGRWQVHSFVGDHNMTVTENTPCVSHTTQRGPHTLWGSGFVEALANCQKIVRFVANNSEMVFRFLLPVCHACPYLNTTHVFILFVFVYLLTALVKSFLDTLIGINST